MAFKLTSGLLALSLSLFVMHLDGVSAGKATRYWDCCQASASFKGKADVYSPVDVCKADGVTLIDPATASSGQSGCNGGDQFMCSCMQPFNDSTDPTLAYGFAAFKSGNEADTDCGCYFAEFAHDEQGQPVKRNKLIFQVVNVGGDVDGTNLDLQIPGGGMGAFTQGCPAQWKIPEAKWGDTFGGVKSASQCADLPESLQSGCNWRFTDWGNNPVMKGSPQRVKCPMSLINRSGCQRKDEGKVLPYSGKTDASNQAAEDGYKRDRSVCLAGGKKEGYAPMPDSGSNPAPGTDSESTKSGREGNAPASAPDTAPQTPPGSETLGSSPEGDASTQPVVPGHYKHKMHKVCKKWH